MRAPCDFGLPRPSPATLVGVFVAVVFVVADQRGGLSRERMGAAGSVSRAGGSGGMAGEVRGGEGGHSQQRQQHHQPEQEQEQEQTQHQQQRLHQRPSGCAATRSWSKAVLFVVNITVLSFSPCPKTVFSKRFWRGNAQPEICSFLYQKNVFKMQFGTWAGRGPRKCPEGINRWGG